MRLLKYRKELGGELLKGNSLEEMKEEEEAVEEGGGEESWKVRIGIRTTREGGGGNERGS